MELLHNLVLGFSVLLQPSNLLACFLGVLIGTLVGVLPGLGPAAAISLLLPTTYKLSPRAWHPTEAPLGVQGKAWKKPFMEILREMKIPFSQVVFTHVNRSPDTLDEFMEFIQAGGGVDLTVSYTPEERPGSLTAAESLRRMIRAGVPLDRVTLSSDSNATRMLPEKRLKYLPIQTLFQVIRELWLSGEIGRPQLVRLVTENPARSLGLGQIKGLVEPGKHADLIILREPFELDGVVLKGKWARRDGQTLIRDPF